ncbi:hypothetical protein KIN20_022343 [Parelaphostrongylus tenuis]|uniref:Uncharacterized protein n=1 Tax=Parelaphostrongylus tenuis TaxID=148309 RepID=A0AAD5N627_PARTN|nr:hypothetical protein KIN20_022343 [Parelaphostrongylus tenuis]
MTPHIIAITATLSLASTAFINSVGDIRMQYKDLTPQEAQKFTDDLNEEEKAVMEEFVQKLQ